MLYGVDIHARYQAGISLSTLQAEGYSFVVTKATEGTSIPWHSTLSQSQFKARALAWVAEARRLGMIPGLYHYLRAGDGAAQARVFHAFVRDAGGPTGLLIQLDCEADATWSDINEWHNEWHRLAGPHPYLLYTGSWWWNAAGRRWNGASLTPYLWHSHYLTADADTISDDPAAFAARIPPSWWTPGYGGWGGATILQFTSRGDAGSLGNNVDLNATRLTRDQLLALTRTSGAGSAGPLPIGDDDMSWTESLAEVPAETLATGEHVPAVKDATVPAGWALMYALRHAYAARKVVEELLERPAVQAAPVDPATLKAALLDPEVLAAIAKAVADENHRRQAA